MRQSRSSQRSGRPTSSNGYDDPAARADMRALELSRLTNSARRPGSQVEARCRPMGRASRNADRLRNGKARGDCAVRSRPRLRPTGHGGAGGTERPRAGHPRSSWVTKITRPWRNFVRLGKERAAVASLQGRLPANLALSAKQSDALAMAMHEERGAQTRELASRGHKAGSYGTDGMYHRVREAMPLRQNKPWSRRSNTCKEFVIAQRWCSALASSRCSTRCRTT